MAKPKGEVKRKTANVTKQSLMRYPPRSRTTATLYQAPVEKPRPKRLSRKDGKKVKKIKRAVPIKKSTGTKKATSSSGKKKGNEKLVPRTGIRILQKDPFFSDPKIPEFVSVQTYYRWLIRALRRKDLKEVKKFFESKRFTNTYENKFYSYACLESANLEVAKSGDPKFIAEFNKLSSEASKSSSFTPVEPNLLQMKQTGRSNIYMVGVRTRAVEMARGGCEGNNAFLKYGAKEDSSWLERVVQHDVPYSVLTAASQNKNFISTGFSDYQLSTCVVTAVRMGHRKLAAALARGPAKNNLNELHIRTLAGEKLPDRILTASVLKKGFENNNITPLHTAAINNDVKYLETLRTVCPNFNVPDLNNWYTVHYASVCDGPEPLKFLIKTGASVAATTKQAESCLHVAARAGRAKNVEIIIDELLKLEKMDASDCIKPVKSMLNARNRRGLTSLHLAVEFNRPEVITKLLSKETVLVDMPSSTGLDNFTPFMMACAKGNLDLAKLLFSKGALVECKDKKKKTALTYAVVNGQLHIVSYLLSLGADLHTKDSSNNTPAHYAAAYGWLHVLEYLAEVDDSCLSVENSWMLTPLHVAYLNGHYGIVNWLLDGKRKDKVNINGKDNDGSTLLASLLTYAQYDSGICDQIKYLVDRGADASLADGLGSTPLHVFASSRFELLDKPGQGLTIKQCNAILDLLMKANADVLKKNNNGKTALHLSLKTNLAIFELLLEKINTTGGVFEEWSENGNFLHDLLSVPFDVYETRDLWHGNELQRRAYDVSKAFKTLKQEDIAKWLKETDSQGRTPLALIVQRYTTLNTGRTTVGQAAAQEFIHIINTIIETLVNADKSVLTEKVPSGPEGKTTWLWANAHEVSVESQNARALTLLSRILNLAHRTGVLEKFLTVENVDGNILVISTVLMGQEEATKKILQASALHSITKGVHDSIQKTEKQEDKVIEVNRTLLMLIVKARMFDLVEFLVLPKEHWALRDAEDSTVFHYAARINHHRVVQLFKTIEKYLPLRQAGTNSKGRTALHEASIACDGSANSVLEPVTWLSTRIDAKTKDKEERMAIHYAFGNESNFKEKNLHAANTDPIALVSILAHAVEAEQLNDADIDGNTVLHLAALRDATVCAVTFLRKGVRVNVNNKAGNTPLGLAVLHGKRSITLTLIQANSNVTDDVFYEEKEQETKNTEWIWECAQEAIKKAPKPKSSIPAQIISKGSGWESMMYVLLDTLGGIDVDPIVLLLKCAIENNQYNLANQLLKRIDSMLEGKQINLKVDLLTVFAKSFKGLIQLECIELVVLNKILSFGDSIIDKQGVSLCIEAAFENKNWSLVEFFKNKLGKTWTKLKGNPIQKVFSSILKNPKNHEAWRWFKELIKLPLMSVDDTFENVRPLDQKYDVTNLSPLGWAVMHGSPVLIKELISLGANKRLADEKGRTPLMLATMANKKSCVEALFGNNLERKSNQSSRNGVQQNRNPASFGLFGARPVFGFGAIGNQAEERNSYEGDGDNVSDYGSEDDAEENMEEDVQEDTEVVPSDEVNTIALEDYEPSPKKAKLVSKMKIDTSLASDIDSDGNNFIHYMITPFEWENFKLLRKIAASEPKLLKALLTKTNKVNVSPIELCQRLGQRRMLPVMAKIVGQESKWTLKSLTNIRDLSTSLACPYDVEGASAEYIAKWTEKNVEKKKNEIPKPHKNSEYQKTGELVFDSVTEQYYNILITKSDVHRGTYGFHNFYRMQLIKRKDADLWILFTNWGRIGSGCGEFQRTPFSSEELGAKEFKSIWKSKTGNEWKELESFTPVASKYRLIDVDLSPQSLADLEIPDVQEKKVENPILEFIRDISRPSELKGYAKQNSHAGVQLPFGRITKEQIKKGREILKKCDGTRLAIEKMLTDNVDDEKLLEYYNTVSKLTNDFYAIVPMGNFEFSSLTRFDDKTAIQQAQVLLNRMDEVETSMTVLTAAARFDGEARLSYIKSALECSFEQLKSSDRDSQQILQAVYNTGGRGSDVKGILKITPRKALMDFAKFENDGNQMWLWHGTKPQNIMSIIRKGFLVDPPIASRNGDLFGPGLYLADSFQKSSGYCQVSRNGLKYMFLCKAVLGKTREIRDLAYTSHNLESAVKDEDTLVYTGEHFSDGAMNMNGASLPLLPMKQRRRYEGIYGMSLPFSEYIVRNPERIIPTYVVCFE